MGAAYFYHLTRSSVEQTLLQLLPRALKADWRVEVRGQDAEVMDRLDLALWTGPDESFLPHGQAGGPQDADQPILLTCGNTLTDVACVMAVHGAEVRAEEVQALERVCILFDGHNDAALTHARGQWKALTGAGYAAQYWSQESGAWEKKAER